MTGGAVMTEKNSRKSETFQKTQPKKGDPLEIPVPTREAFFRDLAKLASPDKSQPTHDEPADERE
jgi:hypothetical protein